MRELFWHTVQGAPGTDYMIVDYLFQWGAKDSCCIPLASLLNSWWGQRPSEQEGSVRVARFLETLLLVVLVASARGKQIELVFDWEEVCEELALHFSIDVPLPGPFLEWLVRLRQECELARIALDILGWIEEEEGEAREGRDEGEDAGEDATELVSRTRTRTIEGARDRDDKGCGEGGSRRNSSECQSGSEHKFDRKHSPTAVDCSPLAESHSGTPGKRRCLLRGNIIQVEVPTSGGESRRPSGTTGQPPDTRQSPQRTSQARDPTIILATPPRLLTIPSRSSTPGCSQQVRNLSLGDG